VEPAAAARSVPHTYVRLILQQLLSNAAKFNSPGGQALLDAHLEDDTLVLTVEDDGWGIPPGQRETIFESFYQPSDVLKRPSGGLGLGLALVRVAVQTLEGSIEVESEPGAGSRFVVRLPVEAPLSAA
jgi:signal transduction histidine kinase